MKYLALILICASLSAQKMPYDTIYGKIKSVREKMIFLDSLQQGFKLYHFEDEWGHHGFRNREFTLSRNYTFWYNLPYVQYVNYLRTYDSIGNMTTEKWYYKNGNEVAKYDFKFDQRGNKIEEREIDEEREYGLVKRWGYDYMNRHISTIILYDYDNGYFFKANTYNDDNNLIEEVMYSEDENMAPVTHEYLNKKLVKTYYTCESTTSGKNESSLTRKLAIEYVYDERGNMVQKKDYRSFTCEDKDVTPRVTNMEYDRKNNLIKKHFDTTNTAYITYKYSRENNLIEENVFYLGKKTKSIKYEYKGIKPIKLIFEEDGNKYIINFTYISDKYGNWVEQTKSINGKQLYIRRRNIVYWE